VEEIPDLQITVEVGVIDGLASEHYPQSTRKSEEGAL